MEMTTLKGVAESFEEKKKKKKKKKLLGQLE